jgi:hypothetical protein
MTQDPGNEPTEGPARQSALGGLEWTQSLFDAPLRYQATLTAETLRRLNAPVLEALARQREFAENLAKAAEQIGEVARHVEELARQHGALTERLRDAVEPYVQYVERLGDLGAGR